MTEFSKNSKNKGAFTDSGTGERSKEGPTHPYSGNQSATPSQYSASGVRQSESPEDMDYNFQIAQQNIMPLISTLKQENDHLKHEKEQIEGQMTTLHKLSQTLLAENQQLRRHYVARTSDIKKLIETISINTNEEVNDVTHQTFLIKESNCAIVKHIEALMKELNQLNSHNQSQKVDLTQLTQRNTQVQKLSRDLQIKNKQLFYRCQKLKNETNSLDTTRDDEEINQLLCEVTSLKNTNKGNLLRARGLLLSHNQQKPVLEENLGNLKMKNQQLEEELRELEGKTKAAVESSQTNRQKYDQSRANLFKALKDYERGKSQLESIERQIAMTKQASNQSMVKTSQNQEVLRKLARDKQELVYMIAAKKKAIQRKEEEFRAYDQQQESAHRLNIKKIRDTLAQQEANANEQISTKIAPESVRAQQSINEAKQEFASLVQEVDQLRQTLAKWQNPVREILRVQYELKKRARNKR